MTDTVKTTRKIHWLQILLLGIAAPLLCSAVFATWYLSDPNRLKPFLEKSVGTLTGRALDIKGDFNFSLGRTTTIRAKNIDWYNPPWSSNPIMLHIDSIEASIDLGSLGKDLISITTAKVDGAELVFEWSDSMPMNWDMRDPTATPSTEPLHPIPLALLHADLNDVKLRFIHPSLKNDLIINVVSAKENQGDKNALVLDADLQIEDFNLNLSGQIGPFQELVIAGAVDYQLKLAGTNTTLSSTGSFANLAGLKSPNVDLKYRAANIETILDILQLAPVTTGPATLAAKIDTANETIDASIEGRVGEFAIDGVFSTTDLSKLDNVTLSLTSNGPSAQVIGSLINADNFPDSPYTVKVEAASVPEGLQVSDLSIETGGIRIEGSGKARKLPQLRDFDLALQVSADQFSDIGNILGIKILPNLPFTASATAVASDATQLDVINAKFSLGKANGSATAKISEASDLTGTKITTNLDTHDAREISTQYGLDFDEEFPLKLSSAFTLGNKVIALEAAEFSFDGVKIKATGNIEYDGTPKVHINTTASGNNLDALLSRFMPEQKNVLPTKPWDIDGTLNYQSNQLSVRTNSANLGKTKLGFNGTLTLNTDIPEISADIVASSNNLAETLDSIDLQDVPEKSFSIKTHLQLGSKGIQLSKIDALIDKDSLRGDISSDWPKNPEYLDFNIHIKGKDLAATLPDIPNYKPPSSPYQLHAIGSADKDAAKVKQLNAQLGAAKLSLSGRLNLQDSSLVDDLKLEFSGPRISDVGQIKGITFRPIPFSVSAAIAGSGDTIKFNDFNVQFNKSEVHGDILVKKQNRPVFSATLQSDFLDLNDVIKNLEKSGAYNQTADASPAATDKSTPAKRQRVLSNNPIDFNLLKKADGELDIVLKEFKAFDRTLKNFKLLATLKDGHLDASTIRGDTRFGNLNGTFSIDSAQAPTAVDGKFTATEVIFVTPDMSDSEIDHMPRHNVVSEVHSKGDSLSELGAQLNGYLWLNGRDGRMVSRKLNLLFGDVLSELIDTLNPFSKKSEYTTLSCDAAYLQFTNGIIETAPAIILQTDKLSIIAAGTVNLQTEKINVGFRTSPLRGIGISASDVVNPFIKLGGYLSKPTIVLNPTDTFIKGGAAAATMGVSLVATSLWNRWVDAKDACPKMYKKAVKLREKIAPDNIPELPTN